MGRESVRSLVDTFYEYITCLIWNILIFKKIHWFIEIISIKHILSWRNSKKMICRLKILYILEKDASERTIRKRRRKWKKLIAMEIIKETTLLEKYNYFIVDFVALFLLRSCTEELKLNASILSRTRLTILKWLWDWKFIYGAFLQALQRNA